MRGAWTISAPCRGGAAGNLAQATRRIYTSHIYIISRLGCVDGSVQSYAIETMIMYVK